MENQIWVSCWTFSHFKRHVHTKCHGSGSREAWWRPPIGQSPKEPRFPLGLPQECLGSKHLATICCFSRLSVGRHIRNVAATTEPSTAWVADFRDSTWTHSATAPLLGHFHQHKECWCSMKAQFEENDKELMDNATIIISRTFWASGFGETTKLNCSLGSGKTADAVEHKEKMC